MNIVWIVLGIGVVGVIACFLPQVQASIPSGMRPSAVATTVLMIPAFYFLIGKLFPGPQLDVLAVTTAEVGVVFCTIVLVTGPIWARPVWGIWWTWDARQGLARILVPVLLGSSAGRDGCGKRAGDGAFDYPPALCPATYSIEGARDQQTSRAARDRAPAP